MSAYTLENIKEIVRVIEAISSFTAQNMPKNEETYEKALQYYLNTISVAAGSISYDNSTSGLTATTMQGAVDELDSIIDILKNNEKLITYFEVVSGASSGNQVTVPTNGTIVLDKFGSSKDAILSTVDGNGNVTWQTPKDSSNNEVTTSMALDGTYVFSSTPTAAQVAVIYTFKINYINLPNVDLDNVLAETELNEVTIAQEIHVSKNGSDSSGNGSLTSPYLTVGQAVAAITDSSSSKPYIVYVAPGVYQEDPFTVPQFTSIVGTGDASTYLEANNPNADLITISTESNLTGMTVSGVTNAANALVRLSNTSGVNGRQIIRDFRFGPGSNGFIGSSTTILNAVSFQNVRASGLTEVAFDFVEKMNATILIGLAGSGTQKLVRASTDCLINVFGIRTISVPIGFEYVNNAAITITACDLVQGTTTPVMSSTSTGQFKAISSLYDQSKIDVLDLTTYTGFVDTIEPGEERFSISSELSVGNPELGYESVFGEGDSYTRGLLAYTFDGSSYVNISEDTKDIDITTTLPNLTTNTALYLSSNLQNNSDFVKFHGVKVDVDTALVKGAGDVIWEYWNGSAWTEFSVMFTDSGGSYIPKAQDNFESTGSHQVRFDKAVQQNWVKNDPISSGTSRYWVRFRITSNITTAPIWDQFKLHTSRFESNADGFLEYFGNARPIVPIGWEIGLVEPANASPSNQNLFVSDNLAVGRVENAFLNNATDRIGFNAFLPFNLDTSCPIFLVWGVITDDATAGNIRFIIRWGHTSENDNVYRTTGSAPTTGPNEQSLTLDLAAPTTADTLKYYTAELDVSDMVSRISGGVAVGDVIWVTLERVGTDAADTHSGDIALINIGPITLSGVKAVTFNLHLVGNRPNITILSL